MCTDPFRLRLRQKRYVVMLSIFLIVLIALFFDYTNGRHDSALITGPVISTGTLSPRIATIFAALCTFSACLIFGLHVSNTLGHGLVNPQAVTPLTIAVTLLAAAIWNLLAQKTGVPTSSSHALIGALVGAVTFSAGPSNVIMSGLTPVMTAIVVAPLLGFIGGIILTAVCAKLLKNAASPRLNNLFRPLQILSCGLLALAHGGNDAQKTMGIITLTLASAHYLPSGQTPLWVILSCQSAITIGTMAPQSGKMFRAVSQGITRIRPWEGRIGPRGSRPCAISCHPFRYTGVINTCSDWSIGWSWRYSKRRPSAMGHNHTHGGIMDYHLTSGCSDVRSDHDPHIGPLDPFSLNPHLSAVQAA